MRGRSDTEDGTGRPRRRALCLDRAHGGGSCVDRPELIVRMEVADEEFHDVPYSFLKFPKLKER